MGTRLQHIVIILVWDFGPMSKGRQGKGREGEGKGKEREDKEGKREREGKGRGRERKGKGKGKGCCKRGPYFLHLIWGPVWQKIFFTSESAA